MLQMNARRNGGRPIARRRTVLPERLSESGREALARELADLCEGIFTGVSIDRLRDRVVSPPGEATAIQLYHAADGRTVGYCAVHSSRRQVQGRDVIILRTSAGLLPDYRGRRATAVFGILRALREKLRHPFTPVYLFASLVHMSSYHFFFKYFPQMFPHPDRETPAGIRQVALALAGDYPDPAVSDADPLVLDHGATTIASPQDDALDQRDDRPDVRFFKRRNPGYTKGHGLVVVVPLTFGNMAAAVLAGLRERVRDALGRRSAIS